MDNTGQSSEPLPNLPTLSSHQELSGPAYDSYQQQQQAHEQHNHDQPTDMPAHTAADAPTDTVMNGNSASTPTVTRTRGTKRELQHTQAEQAGVHVPAGSSKHTLISPQYEKMPVFTPNSSDQYIPSKRGEQSTVWSVFRIVHHVDHYVQGWVWCTLGGCRGWVKRGGNGTSAMQNHLKHNHIDIYNAMYNIDASSPADNSADAQPAISHRPSQRLSNNKHTLNQLSNTSPHELTEPPQHTYGYDYVRDPEHPRRLIPELCKQFYTLGWVTGTGGGISIRYQPQHHEHSHADNNHDHTDITHRYEYYIAPSSVQKERMTADDMYVLDSQQHQLSGPTVNTHYKPSQCTPLFFNAYTLRNAGCCIHTHSQHAVVCTLLYGHEFCITHSEMIKGIKIGQTNQNYKFYDNLIIPIIENTAEERDLKQRMQVAMEQYPHSNAVLVRRHGLYVWGQTWQNAKTMTECYDYMFELAIKMKQINIDPTQVPADSEYRHITQQYMPYKDPQLLHKQYMEMHEKMEQLQ